MPESFVQEPETGRSGKNIFELLLAWAAKSKPPNPHLPEAILSIERTLEHLRDELISHKVKKLLAYWLFRVSGRFRSPNFESLSHAEFVTRISDLSEDAVNLDINPAHMLGLLALYEDEVFKTLDPDDWAEINYSLGLAESFTHQNAALFPHDDSAAIQSLELKHKRHGYDYEWDIILVFNAEHIRASSVSFLVWTLSEALQLIPDVDVDIVKAGTGSLWLRLKVYMKTLFQKNEVKQLLEKTRDAVVADQLDKKIETTGKIKAEKEKLETEAELLKQKLDTGPSASEARLARHNELARQEIELQRLRIAAEKEHLENVWLGMQIIEKRANMIREGIGLNDPMQIEINGIRYLSSENGKIQKGASMEVIDSDSTKNAPDDSKPPAAP
jgi:hypothetical protein